MRVITLGDAKIETGKAPIDPRAEFVFATGLFLVFEQNHPINRIDLASLLWPTIERSSRHHRLRQTLTKLRSHGFAFESENSGTLSVRPQNVEIDIARYLSATERLPNNLDCYFLRGYAPRFSHLFSEWLDETRNRMHASLCRPLLQSIAHARASADWSFVERECRRLLEISPLNEEATLALAEAISMRGDKVIAKAVLDEFHDRVGDSPELTAQLRTMRRRLTQGQLRKEIIDRSIPLIGRREVMRQLHDSLSSAKSGTGKAFFIGGEAGIGKSRVLSEASQFAVLQGFAYLQAQCRDGHQHRPLAGFVQLAELLRGMPGALGCSPETVNLLDRLTHHDPRENQASGFSADSAWVFFSVRRALFDLLDAVADEQPLVVAIEDAQWLDSASASLIRDIIASSKEKRIVVLLTGRASPEEWSSSQLPGLEVVALKPLHDNDAQELLDSLLYNERKTMDPGYTAWCVKVAEGNPYFLIELGHHWIESETDHQVPASLSEVLRNRIARLSPDALQVLQAIALLENDSTLTRIESVLELPAHELLSAIDELGKADMISEHHSATDRVTSKHDLLSSVAIDCLSRPAKKFLHRRIAEVLEGETTQTFLASVVWACAKHWQMSGDQRRAWHLAKACAEHLLRVGLLLDAANAFTQGLAYCESDEQRLEMLQGQVASYYHMSAWTKVREIVSSIGAIRARVGQSSKHDDYELMALRAEWQETDWKTILERSVACVDAIDATAAHRAEAGVMALIAMGFINPTGMSNVFTKVEHLLDEQGVKASTRHFGTMVYHTAAGDINAAVLAARQLVAEETRTNDVGNLFRAQCNAGVSFRVAGLFDAAEEAFRAALAIAEEHDLVAARARVLPLLASLALEIGQIDVARECEAELRKLSIEQTHSFAVWDLKSLQVRLALIDKRVEDARASLPRSFEDALSDSAFHRRTYTLALHVAVDLLGDGSTSEERLSALNESFDGSKEGLHQAFAACVLAKAREANGELSKANQLLIDYETRSRREAWPIPLHLKQLLGVPSLAS